MDDTLLNINQLIKYIDDKNIYLNHEAQEYPFNIILSSSDYYYRENFHSDIICSIFNQKEYFIEFFIDFINSFNPELRIDSSNYTNGYASRETHRIDVLIADESSKHCIIIENKINDAGDMRRQLPRYFEIKQKEGFIVDAIVYLSLDGVKSIDKSSWLPDDHKIDNLIVEIAASSKNRRSFCEDYLLKLSESNNCSVQEFSFIRQYIDLLNYLRRNEVNNEVMENFYELLKEQKNYQAATDIVQMMKDLTTYRLYKYLRMFMNNKEPFDKIGIWKQGEGLIFENCKQYTDYNIKFEIYPGNDGTYIIFKIQDEDSEENYIKTILNKLSLDSCFHEEWPNGFSTTFNFPAEESKMLDFVNKFLKGFQQLVIQENN